MVALPAVLLAQRVNTTITGTIADPSGAAIPQAQVTALRSSTGATTTARTDVAGFYVLSNLEPGTYDLRVEKTGFESYVRSGVVLQADRPVTINVSMTIGSQLQSVTVTGEAPQVDVRDQTLTTTITPEMAQDLPLNGRNVLQLMSVAPDVSPSVPGGSYSYYAQQAARPDAKGFFFSASGGRGNSSGFYLDGGVNEDPYDQIANVFPNPDAIQEFSYHTNSYSARFGGRGGGVVNAVTRGGTNQFHGTAFEFVRNGALNAKNFFATENDGLKRNQYGFTVGGPVQKDKTFFFVSWQGTNVRSRPTQNEARVATAAERNGDFSELCPGGFDAGGMCPAANGTQLINPNNNQPFLYNQISPSLFDPISSKILALEPVGAPVTGLAFYGTRLEQNDNQWVGRFDHDFGPKFRLYGRYLYDRLDQPGHSIPTNLLTAAENYYWQTQNMTLNAAYTLRPNLLTTVTGTFNRVGMESTGPAGLPGATQLGINIPNLVTEGSKTSLDFGIGGYFSSFWDGVYRYPRNEFEYENNWTYIKGGHTLEFGGNVKLHERTLRDQDFESDGGFCFYGQLSGDNLADFMLGKPSYFAQYQPAYGNLSRVAPALFITDTWKATRRLTLDLGVRWDPWISYRDISSNNAVVMFNPKWFSEGIHSTRYPNLPSGLLMAGDPGIPDTGIPSHYPVFDPRVGFA